MKKALSFLLLYLRLVNGSSLLKYISNSAYCTGNLTDLELVSASCPDEFGCTWGSTVSVFARFNASKDLPYSYRATVSPTIPRMPSSGMIQTFEYSDSIMNSCGDHLREPAGGDAGYSCPDAGLYNFRSNFTLFGNSTSWYGNWHGFNMGITLRLYDATKGDLYTTCYAEIRVKEGTKSPATDWAFFGAAFASMTGVAAAGYMYRKRRVAAVDFNSESDGSATHFELVTDASARV